MCHCGDPLKHSFINEHGCYAEAPPRGSHVITVQLTVVPRSSAITGPLLSFACCLAGSQQIYEVPVTSWTVILVFTLFTLSYTFLRGSDRISSHVGLFQFTTQCFNSWSCLPFLNLTCHQLQVAWQKGTQWGQVFAVSIHLFTRPLLPHVAHSQVHIFTSIEWRLCSLSKSPFCYHVCDSRNEIQKTIISCHLCQFKIAM